MKCGCCGKQFRTSKDERLAFLNCGYYTPNWLCQSNGIDPKVIEAWGLNPKDCDHFICFDCQFDIESSQNKIGESKMRKRRAIAEGMYDSIDDELNAIENGGWDMFDNSDLANPEMADRIHRDAEMAGMSDLDYVNHEELLDDIKDDFAYEIEDSDIPVVDFNETPFRSFQDIFDEMKSEFDSEGFVIGTYGHRCTDVGDIANEALLFELDAIEEEFRIGLPFDSNINNYYTVENTLKHLSPYANDSYPKCKAFFEMMMRIAQEYNNTVTSLSLNWPPLVNVPSQDGMLAEGTTSLKQLRRDYIKLREAINEAMNRVEVEFTNEDDAEEFYDETQEEFDVQKPSKYSIEKGHTKRGGSVFTHKNFARLK